MCSLTTGMRLFIDVDKANNLLVNTCIHVYSLSRSAFCLAVVWATLWTLHTLLYRLITVLSAATLPVTEFFLNMYGTGIVYGLHSFDGV